MKVYPFDYPLIINDNIFTQFGGVTGTTTPAQRTAAYLTAEIQMTKYIDTFLLPTRVTGTWDYYPGNQFIATDYGYVSELLWVKILDKDGAVLDTLNTTSKYAAIHEDTYGYIFVHDCYAHCHGCGGCGSNGYDHPFKFQAAYTAGLPTGTANQPGMLMALTAASQIVLNEMLLVPANESTGDVGVESFSSLDYSEKRKKWKNSVFGNSPKAAWVCRMVDGSIVKSRRAVMMGRL